LYETRMESEQMRSTRVPGRSQMAVLRAHYTIASYITYSTYYNEPLVGPSLPVEVVVVVDGKTPHGVAHDF